MELADRISTLDTSLFGAIPSETSDDDRRSLLLVQGCVRAVRPYIYLEIGSHLGGTIQPHYADPRCSLIYSIDKRPAVQPDARGVAFGYSDNSSGRMLANLSRAFPDAPAGRIRVFDCDARDVDPAAVHPPPDICFIDGEHTEQAVISDFRFCRSVCSPDAVIAFHDACYVVHGLETITKILAGEGTAFRGFVLPGTVYAIALGAAVDRCVAALTPVAREESAYFAQSAAQLARIRRRNRVENVLRAFPGLYRGLQSVKRRVFPS